MTPIISDIFPVPITIIYYVISQAITRIKIYHFQRGQARVNLSRSIINKPLQLSHANEQLNLESSLANARKTKQ
jgi:hypothetical protein